MTDTTLPTQAQMDVLTAWDTPTICNGLERLDPSYRLRGFTTRQFACARPDMKPVIGFARTAMIRALTVPEMTPAEMTDARLEYYAYIAAEPRPTITVIQDLDSEPGNGAWWGEVNSNIHAGLGSRGTVTNGSIRDLGDWAEGFQGLAGKIGPSHANVHLVGFGNQVEVHGMSVCHGDIVHADVHGAVVVPAEAVAALPDAINAIARREAVLLEAAKSPDFGIERLRQAMADAAKVT